VAGLDGIRAIAVLAVIGYHLNFSWAQGGKLGVGIFFTLSGYLITDLLLGHWERTGGLELKQFWIRRARRLLPALFVMLAVVSVFSALFDAAHLADIRRQVVAAAVYVSNWQTIIDSGSYFARFAPPLPFDHLWSLAIEEQFYLVWPWLLWAGVRWVRNRSRMALLTFAGAIASAVAMALIYNKGQDPTRVYEGTDTRAFELLFGAAVAFVWPTAALTTRIREGARNLLDVLGAVCLAGILVLIASTGSYSSFLYPWGFVLLSIATAILVAVVVHPASRLGRWLGWEPLRWVGVRSYGIYLWQWPIIVFTTPAGGGVNLLRGAGQVGLTFLIASLSWRWIEEPIRRGGFRRFGQRLRAGAARVLLPPQRGIAVAAAAVLLLLLPVLGLAGVLPEISRTLASGQNNEALPGDLAKQAATPSAPATTSSCKRVVYIGDSTSEGSISPEFIPVAAQRIDAQLAAVGVTEFTPYIAGARDIVEDVVGAPNATGIAQAVVGQGYNGCWIIAMGTNDAATIAKGGTNLDQMARIAQLMSAIGDQPVLWVDAVSRLSPPTFYSAENMQLWNQALDAACPTYPNLRVFDWAGLARPEWFQEDGTHYTTPGYIAKTTAIVQGLVHAFPAEQPPSSECVVQ
jgi:peptidoglycan/LPS O-acetylase OafA/YrhL/lysophospholipase L1-like esterase